MGGSRRRFPRHTLRGARGGAHPKLAESGLMLARPWFGGLVAALCMGALIGERAYAQSDAGIAKRAVIELVILGESDERQPLADTIRELLARLHVEVLVAPGILPPSLLARVQVDLGSPHEAAIVVSSDDGKRVLERRSVPRSSSPAILREELAHVVQSAIEAQLLASADTDDGRPGPEGGAPTVTSPVLPPPPHAPSETPAPSDTPSVTAEHRGVVAVDLTTLAGAGPFADRSGLVGRIQGEASMAWRTGPRPSVSVTAQYLFPFDAKSPLVDSQASVASFRAIPAIEVVRTAGVALDVGVGAGVDVLTVSPSSTTLPASGVRAASHRVDTLLTLVLEMHVALTPALQFTVEAAGDLDLTLRRYVVDQGPTQDGLFVPWRVRPTLLVGFTFAALGTGLFVPGAPP
jgi:hypothetical protein